MIIEGRIVQILSDNHYLLRIYGHNLIMKSSVKFGRFEEVRLKVLETKPRIQLRIFDPKTELFWAGQKKGMNFLIE